MFRHAGLSQRWRRNFVVALSSLSLFTATALAGGGGATWTIDSPQEWNDAIGSAAGFNILPDGLAAPTAPNVTFESRIQSFAVKQKFEQIIFTQSDDWGAAKWGSAGGNIGPAAARDAPVFISPAEDDYWFLGALNGGGQYHSWHSTDMVNWTHHGNVTGQDWVTSAEYANGKYYVYYDEPNDEDSHLRTFTDLGNVSTRVNVGRVITNPAHGSDAAIFRDLDGTFHLIYEDWSAINARTHSWDSQFAGHATSPDGVNGFVPLEATSPIDRRGNPLGTFGSYVHPHNGTQTYENHDGPLDAYGDYEMLRVGDTYYLFHDYDPEGENIRLGYWKGKSLDEPFEWGGVIGGSNFHPDPTAGFAEGMFMLMVQNHDDFTSRGPWVDGVMAQAGVDTDGDGAIDVWTDWQNVIENYTRIEGFAKVFGVDPAALDLSSLPEGYGLQFRFKTADTGALMDKVVLISDAAIPEPTSMALLGLGGLMLLRRRVA